MTVECPPRYLAGVRLFNAGRYFECHDVLEELWSETAGREREFYQGLIHAAVSLFHFEEGNLGGARKMSISTQRYLRPFCPRFMRANLDIFLADYRACFSELMEATGSYPAHLRICRDLVPSISFCDGPLP